MKKYLTRHKFLFVFYLVSIVISTAFFITIAYYLRYVIDAATEMDKDKLFISLYVGIAYAVLIFVMVYVMMLIKSKYIKKTMLSIKEDLFDSLVHSDISSFNENNSAKYISVLNNDVKMVQDHYIETFFKIVNDGLMLVFAIIAMIIISPLIALITIALSFVPVLIPALLGKKIAELQKTYSGSLEKYNEKIKDIFTGFEIVKTFKIEKNIIKNHDEANQCSEQAKYRLNRANGLVMALSNLAGVGVQFAIFIISGFLVLNGHFTVGAIVAVLQLSGQVVSPIMNITQSVTAIKSVKSVNEKIAGMIDSKPPANVGISVDSFRDKIEIKELGFAYGAGDEGRNVLNDVSMTIKKGGKYAVVGGSGSGKSTILKLVLRYYDNFDGQILIDGRDNREINMESIYNMCSTIHQNVFMFDDSLKNNITLFNEYDDNLIQSAVEKAGLVDVISSLDGGIEAHIAESGGNFSGGEKQRIAIARALIKGSDILFMDEATASLDNETAYNIESSLLKLDGLTCLIVTHRYNKELLKQYDGIFVFKDGNLRESGGFDELMERKDYFYSLYNIAN